MSSVWLGLVLTLVVTVVLTLVFGSQAIVPGLLFGGLATAIQLAAVLLVKPFLDAELKMLMKRWGYGMALRVLGVGLFVVAVLGARDIFPPLPTAFAYLGVLVPLLFTEIRLIK